MGTTRKAPPPPASTMTAMNFGLTAHRGLSQVTRDTRTSSMQCSLFHTCAKTWRNLLCLTTPRRKDILLLGNKKNTNVFCVSAKCSYLLQKLIFTFWLSLSLQQIHGPNYHILFENTVIFNIQNESLQTWCPLVARGQAAALRS